MDDVKKKIIEKIKEFNKLFPDPIEWKPIPGFTKYGASTDSRIRNTWTDYILKPYINNGYYAVRLSGMANKLTIVLIY